MAAFDYGAIQAIASPILNQFKQGSVSITIETPGAGPAYQPGPSTKTDYELDAVARGVPMAYIIGKLADQGDLIVTSAVHPTMPREPRTGDSVTIDGKKYRVASINPAPVAGVKVVWKFIAKR